MKPYYEHAGIVIFHGDCREILPHVSGDVLLTDPDYGVGMKYGDQALAGPEADALLISALSLAQVSRDWGLIFWSGSHERLFGLPPVLALTPWRIRHLGIWYKSFAPPSGNGLARRFETWFWLDRSGGNAKKESEWDKMPDCLQVNRIQRDTAEAWKHPSQKPIELMRRLIRFFSLPNETIIEPFAGSGSTLCAAKDTGRKAIGIEIREEYCEIAAKRLSQEVLQFEPEAQ